MAHGRPESLHVKLAVANLSRSDSTFGRIGVTPERHDAKRWRNPDDEGHHGGLRSFGIDRGAGGMAVWKPRRRGVVVVILAGGQGERLSILSAHRAKPAVPFAGKYRIIDFALSNCVNSGLFDIVVLTQYRPVSLHDHIGTGKPWDLDRQQSIGVRLISPYLGRRGAGWYRGNRRRRLPEHPGAPGAELRARDDPGRGPHLLDGLPGHDRPAHPQERGLHDRPAEGPHRGGPPLRPGQDRPFGPHHRVDREAQEARDEPGLAGLLHVPHRDAHRAPQGGRRDRGLQEGLRRRRGTRG